jgi:hypothetical protein
MAIVLVVYRELRIFFGFFCLLYGWQFLKNVYAWNKMIYDTYSEYGHMTEQCGFLFQNCTFSPAYYLEQDLLVFDGVLSLATCLVLLLLFKAEEFMQQKQGVYGGVHMRFRHEKIEW